MIMITLQIITTQAKNLPWWLSNNDRFWLFPTFSTLPLVCPRFSGIHSVLKVDQDPRALIISKAGSKKDPRMHWTGPRKPICPEPNLTWKSITAYLSICILHNILSKAPRQEVIIDRSSCGPGSCRVINLSNLMDWLIGSKVGQLGLLEGNHDGFWKSKILCA